MLKFLIPLLVSVMILSYACAYAYADANFKAGGDFGCKSAAITNLKNLAKDSNSFFGAGDYSYKCSSSKIKSLWDQVPSKRLALGNHECSKSGQDSLKVGSGYSSSGGCKKGYSLSIRGNSVAVFVLNQYTSYKAGSAQYNFVVNGLKKVSNMSNIIDIVFVFHEPIYPVPCSGSHCHGLEKASFKSTYEPLIKQYHILVIQAHTHLIAFGTVNGVRTAECGGGGEDGTSLNGNGSYTYVSKAMGYCYIHLQDNKTVIEQIGTSGQILHTHTWN